ncbi:MAG: DUF115 domain-containing protein, partial [Treponema sp.]|nr:DUF115 domain-containing protein [Treponema sp.]
MTDLSVLEKNYPDLLSELEKNDEDELKPQDFAVEVNQAGQPVLKIRGIYIHSPRDPVREGKRQAEAAAGAQGPVIMLGFGLGYAAEAAAEIAPDRPLVIVERRREILRLALKHRDLGPFLLKNRVIFVLGGKSDQVSTALSLLEKNEGRPLIIKNRALISIDNDFYKEAENNIYEWVSRSNINKATLRRFGKRWVRNLSQNLPAIRDMPGIGRLKNLLQGSDIPVFLAAAGPTLDVTSGIMPEIAKRALVIAVDTSLRFVLGTGTEPDFAVSLDPQYWNFRHLDRTKTANTCLIAESAVYPACLRHPFKSVYLCGSLFPL